MQASRLRTRYRPDGGDRYIPVRESESEWSMKKKLFYGNNCFM